MAIHVAYTLNITDLPQDCILDCSASGSVDEAISYWREKLGFTVDRSRAIDYLVATGGWEREELVGVLPDFDNTLAERCLWCACGEFRGYMDECEKAGVNPREPRPDGFEPNCGSDLFVLEG